MPLLIIVLLIPVRSVAFLNFIGDQAKKAVEVAAYTDAVNDLVSEISPSSELAENANSLNLRAESLRREARSLNYITRSTKEALSGPNWTSKRLDHNIRATTEYIKRLKRLLAKISLLGTEGATALSVTETNAALNEVQKNQQVLIMQNEEMKLREISKEQESAKSWSDFSLNQKSIRERKAISGKP